MSKRLPLLHTSGRTHRMRSSRGKISNGNRTEWSPIRSIIIRVIHTACAARGVN